MRRQERRRQRAVRLEDEPVGETVDGEERGHLPVDVEEASARRPGPAPRPLTSLETSPWRNVARSRPVASILPRSRSVDHARPAHAPPRARRDGAAVVPRAPARPSASSKRAPSRSWTSWRGRRSFMAGSSTLALYRAAPGSCPRGNRGSGSGGGALRGSARPRSRRALRENRLPGSKAPPYRPGALRQPGAAFVALRVEGQLRGCMGRFTASRPRLVDEVLAAAVLAASRDPRFPPVRPSASPTLRYEVYFLGALERLKDLRGQDPRVHGLLVQGFRRRGGAPPRPPRRGHDRAAAHQGRAGRRASGGSARCASTASGRSATARRTRRPTIRSSPADARPSTRRRADIIGPCGRRKSLEPATGSARTRDRDAGMLRRGRQGLLALVRRHGRDLPWRRTREPYRVLVSEIMLQQTQVDRVIPKYQQFLRPVSDARSAGRGAAWTTSRRPGTRSATTSGRCACTRIACETVARYGGRLPDDADTLRAAGRRPLHRRRDALLRASAATSPILDTNVRRVLGRVFLGNAPRGARATRRSGISPRRSSRAAAATTSTRR